MKECPACKGSKKGNPTSSGMESSWRINQYLMSQPCKYCDGKGEVADSRAKLSDRDYEIYCAVQRSD